MGHSTVSMIHPTPNAPIDDIQPSEHSLYDINPNLNHNVNVDAIMARINQDMVVNHVNHGLKGGKNRDMETVQNKTDKTGQRNDETKPKVDDTKKNEPKNNETSYEKKENAEP